MWASLKEGRASFAHPPYCRVSLGTLWEWEAMRAQAQAIAWTSVYPSGIELPTLCSKAKIRRFSALLLGRGPRRQGLWETRLPAGWRPTQVARPLCAFTLQLVLLLPSPASPLKHTGSPVSCRKYGRWRGGRAEGQTHRRPRGGALVSEGMPNRGAEGDRHWVCRAQGRVAWPRRLALGALRRLWQRLKTVVMETKPSN